ncbi:MAG TPA: hypothetical protein VN577_01725 [Terriglobales bacterium]|nr:hypothetical protein [Terriglobales bacterium]
MMFMVVGMVLSGAAWVRYNSTRRHIETSGPLISAPSIITMLFGGVLVAYLIYTQKLF